MSDVARRVQPGDLLRVRDAHGDVIEVQAVSELYRGRDFPVVLVCWPRSYSLPPKERPDRAVAS